MDHDDNDNPVANGLIALVSVALVVGLLTAVIALLGTRLVGLTGGGSGSANGAGVGDTLSLPPLEPTELDSGLLITLAPSPTASSSATDTEEPLGIGESDTPTPEATATASDEPRQVGEHRIILSAAGSTMKVGEELMLSGTYRGGEGAVLGIFYNVNGEGWEEFNVDTNVYGGVFQVFVSTYKAGVVEWRVEDPANGNQSNSVRVRYED